MLRGWINYFKPASILGKLKKLEEWLRNRLRYCIWHHWKKPERKRKNLIRLGINPDQAYAWSRTRMGGWAVAQSPILRTTITIKRLKMKGYVSLIEYYNRWVSLLNRPVRDPYAGWCEGCTPSFNGGAIHSISGSYYSSAVSAISGSVISGTSKIIGTFDFKAFPAAIACLNLKFGKTFAIPCPK